MKEESGSITMQRILLKNYAADHFTNYELLEFCDDGYTGTNFERPGIRKMLEKIKKGEIDCVIVKDFSRFARDYIELGSYLEQIFPFLGLRFISINDNYDSSNYQGGIADITINFKNLLYDLYSKDLSGKVRSALSIRKEKGQYVSANSPFGYEKDPEDRHALQIAEDEAEVVRRIFSLTAEGHTSSEIAKLLNETEVKTPIEFKIEKGKTSRVPKGEKFFWSSSTICQILKNEVYIGNAVQKKYRKDFVGGRNHVTPPENWLITYGHHEPIIEKELFDKIQETRRKTRNLQCRHRGIHPKECEELK
ncbi:MAG: recombinase family protein [Lachnospiraceae bacterium]|nr:recombinase family protein [Lachnospiraceae bacterium]